MASFSQSKGKHKPNKFEAFLLTNHANLKGLINLFTSWQILVDLGRMVMGCWRRGRACSSCLPVELVSKAARWPLGLWTYAAVVSWCIRKTARQPSG